MRATFDGDGLVDDVTLDPRTGGQAHFQPANPANDPAIDDHVIGRNLAFDGGAFAHGQKMRANVAVNRTFDLNITSGLEVAGDVQIR